jgi:hypothetical protein
MYVKADISAGGYYRGNTIDYRVGDTVVLQFVNGKTERPLILGLAPRHNNEEAILAGEVPALGVKSENNPEKQSYPTASPEAVIPGAVKHNYDVTGQVIPIQVSNESFATNYVPASAVWSAGGDYHIYPAGTFTVKAAHSQIIVAAPNGSQDPVLEPFSDLQQLEISPHITHRLTRAEPYGDYAYIPKDNNPITYDRLLKASQDLFPIQQNQEVIEKAQVESLAVKALEGCITSNLGSVGDLLGTLLKIVAPIALEQLNSILPDFLQVSLNEDGSFGIGPLSVDPSSGMITFNGEFFNGFIEQGLSLVTEMLPDFLGLNLSGGFLNIGDMQLDLNTMDFSMGDIEIAGFTISQNENGDLTIKMGDSILQTLTSWGQSILGKPLAELNKMLPEGMQVGMSLGENGMPVFNIGPLSLDFSKGFESLADIVTLDVKGLTDLIGGQLEGLFGNLMGQLPKPVMMLAQALWEELNIGGLIMGILQDLLGEAGTIIGGLFGLEAGGKDGSVIGTSSFTCNLASLPSFSNNGPVLVSSGGFLDMNQPMEIAEGVTMGTFGGDSAAPSTGGATPIAPASGKK